MGQFGKVLCHFVMDAPARILHPSFPLFALNVASDRKRVVAVAAIVIMPHVGDYAVSFAVFLVDFRA